MPLEIEAKFRVDSHEPVRDALRAAGALRLGLVMEWNVILDAADGTLRNRGCGLRVRSARDEESGDIKSTLTFKGPRTPGEFKSREEIEFELNDAGAACEMLARLGFAAILQYEKSRESWQLDDCRVELDEPPKIGLFVEIEGPDEASVQRVREKLRLGDTPVTQASYVRMLVEYCNQYDIEDRTLRL
ncbi:MAG: class IV adenylate cyclase [Phycisphaerae bacterium]|nr:class IV adenylate cyclase [Phycisphaerae bacterium]